MTTNTAGSVVERRILLIVKMKPIIADNRQGPCGKNLVFFVTHAGADFSVSDNKRRGEELDV